MTQHPSYLRLDEHRLGLGGDEALQSHLSSCERCAAHLARLEDVAELPSALRERAQPGNRTTEEKPERRSRWLAWGGSLALAGAAAAALALVVVNREPAADGADIAVKGGATVGVYIKRGEDVTLWNGRSPVTSGDRIRLGVVSPGHTHVAVFSELAPGGAKRFQLLYEGELRAVGTTLLPSAWEVDAVGDSEVLIVVTADRYESPASLKSKLRSAVGQRIDPTSPAPQILSTGGLWIQQVVLAKEANP